MSLDVPYLLIPSYLPSTLATSSPGETKLKSKKKRKEKPKREREGKENLAVEAAV